MPVSMGLLRGIGQGGHMRLHKPQQSERRGNESERRGKNLLRSPEEQARERKYVYLRVNPAVSREKK